MNSKNLMTSIVSTIIHCSETNFFDSFRADLIKCQEQATILSPFLSYNRAVRYYPILQSLAARDVRIDIYAKPRNEQPESLQDTFDVVERGLKRRGTHFHVRPGMHEKIGVIDRKILWHGSLNILSHNDTRESMLRFESSDLVEEVLKDLKISVFSDLKPEDQWSSTHRDIADEALSCPKCGQKMVFLKRLVCGYVPIAPVALEHYWGILIQKRSRGLQGRNKVRG